ncbi:MAG: NADH-quinone oxidoreductase subunit C [Paracoccus sp. (in: a-proteobacteria)]|uniref:NADH-quinone oxidoreductase subunit C n=1 Tax=Paracoccus sp. TaxID=267 RepID=UPI0026E0179F|nr:NADH-quinone oxidoreductase subunit C [Paracoccus sp. (in: a-proteobacteria)]MDO5622517.1 NADH-quinone oxidoreductase subunit C [Paracoccus sp. (in: a-proteobacteria)]
MSVYPDLEGLADLAEMIAARFPDHVQGHAIHAGDLTVTVTLSGLREVAEFLHNDASCQFTSLIDITAIDWPQRAARFDMVWHLLSMHRNRRIRLKAAAREDDLVPSLIPVYPNANWYEREVFDLFGILFAGHPDLRRILTDYGFRGHPLRKDFPTTGYVEVRYSDAEKRVVYEPVKLVQEYRQFDFLSPWEGAQYVLPGDEKGAEK